MLQKTLHSFLSPIYSMWTEVGCCKGHAILQKTLRGFRQELQAGCEGFRICARRAEGPLGPS